ncbi:hypothetical protein BvRS1_49450 [Burkholderia vietnamiensis]|nr:hypothetical protein BvRS1_49450 [Burkholderia vietnamiensis]
MLFEALRVLLREMFTAKWIVFSVACLAVAWFLIPFVYSPNFMAEQYGTSIPLKNYEQLPAGEEREYHESGQFPINWLLDGHFDRTVRARAFLVGPPGTKPTTDVNATTVAHAVIRMPQLTVAAALLLIIFASTSFLSKNLSRPNNLTPAERQWRFELPELDCSPDAALRVEMKNAWIAANRFYNGALYLLAAGVFMAFVGMVAFFFTLPDYGSVDAVIAGVGGKDQWQAYALRSLRPFGLLVFIEAIAWFLLRQYRAATEDFKAFNRIYLRRSNYFVARKAYAESSGAEKSLLIGAALLAEDLSSRLSAGQTTETIEAMKVDDTNPVFNLLQGAVGRVAPNEKNGDDKKGEDKKRENKPNE